MRYLADVAQREGRPLVPTKETTYRLLDDGRLGDSRAGSGVYRASLPRLRVEGVYTFGVRVEASVCGGRTMREATFSVLAPLTPDVDRSETEVVPGDRAGSVNLRLTLRDGLGNYAGPGSADLISARLAPEDGKLERVVDNLDGSYTLTIEGAHDRSVLTLDVAGLRRRIPILEGTDEGKRY